jgi:hypothetical protein
VQGLRPGKSVKIAPAGGEKPKPQS